MISRCLPQFTTTALLTAALCAAPAMGQVQVQNGAALDANQQVGGGGYNQATGQVDYRARNLLITGNVGGGRAFRGTINYGADGDFRGTLGSDSLFNFQRDSIYSTPGAPSYGIRNYGSQVVVTRPTSSISGYRVNTGAGLTTRTSYDPAAGVVTFRQSGGGLIAVTGVRDPGRLTSGGRTLGLVNTPTGPLSINASPLTGIQYNPLDANTNRPNLRRNITPNRVEQLPSIEPGDDPSGIEEDSLTARLRVDGRYNPGLVGEDGPETGLRQPTLSLTLGTQMQSSLLLQAAGRENKDLTGSQAQNIRMQLFGPTAALDPNQPARPPEAPKSPYEQLIADILAQAKGSEEGDPDTDTPAPVEDERPRWQQILEEPEKAVLDAKNRARETALRISLGMVDDQGNVDFEQELPKIDPDSKLGKLLDDLAYELPRIRTLAGEDKDRTQGLMVKGEQELKAGRYIVAENYYRQVLRDTKEQPLAKAGLIHSQMGAGMIRSAAYNLRGLFTEHPELIAVRYDTKLMPATQRLRWLQGRLQTMITDGTQGADPGLVLAYLGHQLEAKPLIEFGLAVAEEKAPRDPLMPVLRSIWLGEKDKTQIQPLPDREAVEQPAK